MKHTLFLVAALLSTAALADRSDTNSDRRGARTSITVTIDALTCTTTAGASSFNANAWSWGANNTATIGSGAGGGGRVVFADLSVTKALDACSPALFRAVSTGLHFRTLTLIQQDASGNVLTRVEMQDVIVTSWGVGGTARDPSPDEVVKFAFSEACVISGPNRVCYDVRLGRVV